MPDYTEFQFIELGQRAITRINGVVAQTGIWYQENDVITNDKQDANHYGEPYDILKYKVKNSNLFSNEASIILNFPPNKSLEPLSQDVTITSSNSTTIDLVNHIPYNSAVDRIKIISFNNQIGELEFFNSLVFPNKVIMQYDLNELKFNTLTGNGSPYQKIYYKVGNADGYNDAIYSVTINIDGQASLINLFQNEDEVNDNGVAYKYIEGNLKIENGYINGIANIEVNVQLSNNAFPTTTQNQLIIDTTGNNLVIQENGISYLDIDLGSTGEDEINFTLGINLDDIPVTGTISFKLININQNVNLVSSNNEDIITINF